MKTKFKINYDDQPDVVVDKIAEKLEKFGINYYTA